MVRKKPFHPSKGRKGLMLSWFHPGSAPFALQDVHITDSVQAGEGYDLLAGWSACSRWRFLSVYLWGEACLAC